MAVAVSTHFGDMYRYKRMDYSACSNKINKIHELSDIISSSHNILQGVETPCLEFNCGTVQEPSYGNTETPDIGDLRRELSMFESSDSVTSADDVTESDASSASGQTSVGVARAGSSLKDNLRHKIQQRRHSEGRLMPEILFEQPKIYQLTQEEKLKMSRRRERNRLSANKSRLKRIQQQQRLEEEIRQLEQENLENKKAVEQLNKFKRYCLRLLRSHNCLHGKRRQSSDGGPSLLQKRLPGVCQKREESRSRNDDIISLTNSAVQNGTSLGGKAQRQLRNIETPLQAERGSVDDVIDSSETINRIYSRNDSLDLTETVSEICTDNDSMLDEIAKIELIKQELEKSSRELLMK